ncbi:MAG: hypothetical protein ACK41Y_16470, partial [Paracoccus hibiscisoli]|uniref:hypothetical protein n=1 Tax=Paracoccus hibiscisoli TaxID=2023261 RepID=UPI00391A309B
MKLLLLLLLLLLLHDPCTAAVRAGRRADGCAARCSCPPARSPRLSPPMHALNAPGRLRLRRRLRLCKASAPPLPPPRGALQHGRGAQRTTCLLRTLR